MLAWVLIVCTNFGAQYCSGNGAPSMQAVTEAQCIAATKLSAYKLGLKVWCISPTGEVTGN